MLERERLVTSRTRILLPRRQNFMSLIYYRAPNLNTQFSPMRASQLALPYAVGHPKMEKLREIVLAHFQKCLDGIQFETNSCDINSKNV